MLQNGPFNEPQVLDFGVLPSFSGKENQFLFTSNSYTPKPTP
jgi:hypothetical protein